MIARKKGLPRAEEFLTLLPGLPLRLIPATREIILQGARFKAQYALSYADCVTAASAVANQAVLVTGDPEFRALKHLVEIEWIQRRGSAPTVNVTQIQCLSLTSGSC